MTKTIKEMIKYFEGVRAQHEAFIQMGFKTGKDSAETIIKTYAFVINKLKEWEND